MHNLDLQHVIYVLTAVVVLGVIDWAICSLAPLPPKFAQIIHVICVLVAVFYALREFGLIAS